MVAEAHDAVKPQYVFTMTDGGFAKRSRITEYRQQSRGGIGIKTMSLENQERGSLVGAFIVVEGDEILSITQGGQVVRSPINADFRATGRSTMGVKFVTPKDGDAVAVVTRSVETPDEVLEEASDGVVPEADAGTTQGGEASARRDGPEAGESPDVVPDATIEDQAASSPESPESENGPDVDPGE
jgi:DNA gyrase subunit A